MRTFAQKQNQSQRSVAPSPAGSITRTSRSNRHTHPILHLQRMIGNQAVQRLLQTNPEEIETASVTTASTRDVRNVSWAPLHPTPRAGIQTKLTVTTPGDIYE